LNPYTPLAFMPPDVADQYQVVLYVYVATLSVSLIQRQATIGLTLSTYRLTHGIGSCQFQKSTQWSVERDSVCLMSHIFYRGP